jgi:hypothetical protein
LQALDGVGGVDHAAHLGREGEKRDHVLPGPAPQCRNRRVFGAPRPLGEGLQRRPGRTGIS